MQKHILSSIIILVITLALPGCLMQENKPKVTDSHTEIPTTPTQVPHTSTPAKVTNTPEASIRLECLNITTDLAWDTKIDETLAIANNKSGTITLLQKDGIDLPLKDEMVFVSEYSVSPDTHKLALHQYNSQKQELNRLIIVEPGTDPLIYSWEKDWFRLAGWFNNDSLLLEKDERNDNGYIANPVSLITWDYLSETAHELSPSYPGIYSLYPEIDRWANFKFSETIYDPSFEYVIYPKMTPYDSLVLWDVKAQKQITNLTGFVFYGVEPKWSPNGDSFIVAKYPHNSNKYLPEFTNQQELFNIEQDGAITKLTNLTDEYSEISFGQFSWSPDAKHIAFWLYLSAVYPNDNWIHSDKYPRLAVLDMDTLQITNYCIPGGFFEEDNGSSSFISPDAPLWSPNSTELVVPVASENGSTVVVINLLEAKAIQILDTGFPVGWLNRK